MPLKPILPALGEATAFPSVSLTVNPMLLNVDNTWVTPISSAEACSQTSSCSHPGAPDPLSTESPPAAPAIAPPPPPTNHVASSPVGPLIV